MSYDVFAFPLIFTSVLLDQVWIGYPIKFYFQNHFLVI
jgi:hypothetical protein